jgi:FixJ family two-component response regulator
MSGSDCVYVVDGDSSARRGLARLLRAAGHEVHDFASANEFLDALGPEICGCLVLDVRMPGLSNKELQEALEERGICLSIIVVTADDNDETRRHAEEMKAKAFFRKPVDGTALLDAIDWALRSTGKSDKHEME